MTQTFQQLEHQISKILTENYQLKQELAIQVKRPITETRALLLAIIQALRPLKKEKKYFERRIKFCKLVS